jgi:hypothetical protein
MVTISGGGSSGGAADSTAQNIMTVIQTALATQLITRGGLLDTGQDGGSADTTKAAAKK